MIFAMLLFLSKRREYIHQEVGKDNRMLTTFRLAAGLLIEQLYSYQWIARYCSRIRPTNLLQGPRQLVPTFDTTDPDDFRLENRPQQQKPTCCDDNSNDNNDPWKQHNDYTTQDDATDARWKELLDDARQTLNIIPVLLMFSVFWTLYDQQGSVWTLQATRMYLPLGM